MRMPIISSSPLLPITGCDTPCAWIFASFWLDRMLPKCRFSPYSIHDYHSTFVYSSVALAQHSIYNHTTIHSRRERDSGRSTVDFLHSALHESEASPGWEFHGTSTCGVDVEVWV